MNAKIGFVQLLVIINAGTAGVNLAKENWWLLAGCVVLEAASLWLLFVRIEEAHDPHVDPTLLSYQFDRANPVRIGARVTFPTDNARYHGTIIGSAGDRLNVRYDHGGGGYIRPEDLTFHPATDTTKEDE